MAAFRDDAQRAAREAGMDHDDAFEGNDVSAKNKIRLAQPRSIPTFNSF